VPSATTTSRSGSRSGGQQTERSGKKKRPQSVGGKTRRVTQRSEKSEADVQIIAEDDGYKRPYINILYMDDPDFNSKNWGYKFRKDQHLIRNTGFRPLC